jgi:hypothetical protein
MSNLMVLSSFWFLFNSNTFLFPNPKVINLALDSDDLNKTFSKSYFLWNCFKFSFKVISFPSNISF